MLIKAQAAFNLMKKCGIDAYLEEEEEEQGIGRLGLVTVTGAARDGSNALEDEATHEQEPLKAIIIIEMRYKGRTTGKKGSSPRRSRSQKFGDGTGES